MLLLDQSDQVQVDNLSNCRVFIGALLFCLLLLLLMWLSNMVSLRILRSELRVRVCEELHELHLHRRLVRLLPVAGILTDPELTPIALSATQQAAADSRLLLMLLLPVLAHGPDHRDIHRHAVCSIQRRLQRPGAGAIAMSAARFRTKPLADSIGVSLRRAAFPRCSLRAGQ